MFAGIFDDLTGRSISVVIGLLFGGMVAWIVGRYRRAKERQQTLDGDARDTVVINLHVVESEEVQTETGTIRVPKAMRVRALGQAELNRVVPNGHLATVLLERAFEVTAKHTLISMEGAKGSYLLETLTGFVCDRVANGAFEHELYAMVPCCEPKEFAHHQPITILLIALRDLELFEEWLRCRHVLVEHGSDGTRVLTLMEMAKRFRAEQRFLDELRKDGKRTVFEETMYVLDLALDRRTAPLPLKTIPWQRYTPILEELGLQEK